MKSAPASSSSVLAAGPRAACSSGGASVSRPRSPVGAPPRRHRRRPPSSAAELTIFGAASLKGALDKAKAAYEAANPGHDADDLDRLVVGARDPDRAGRPGRRLPVGRHDEPEEARRQGPRRRATRSTFAGNKLTVIVPTANPAGITSPADLAKPGVKVIAAGDEVPITKYATQLVDEPGQGARLSGRLRRGVRRQHRVEGGQRQGGRRQGRARRG